MGTPISSNNKTIDMAEILLKVALNTITPTYIYKIRIMDVATIEDMLLPAYKYVHQMFFTN